MDYDMEVATTELKTHLLTHNQTMTQSDCCGHGRTLAFLHWPPYIVHVSQESQAVYGSLVYIIWIQQQHRSNTNANPDCNWYE